MCELPKYFQKCFLVQKKNKKQQQLAEQDLPQVLKSTLIKHGFNDNSILNNNPNRQDILSWFFMKPVIVYFTPTSMYFSLHFYAISL